MRIAFAISGLLLLAGCGGPVQSPPSPVQRPVAVTTASGTMLDSEIAREVGNLRASLLREVPHSMVDDVDGERRWISRARSAIDAAAGSIKRTQLIVVVDRSPVVQQLRIILARPDVPWQVIGGSKVSTGQSGRRGYYITPIGVFLHDDGILDYRALGTFNENHIRGLGLRGMRVWDFGWQIAERGWRADREPGEIRLLMHATDPDYLEQRLGRPASQGCVRIPSAMNRFLDRHGVLDSDYERAARDDPRFRAILPADREPTLLAGNLLVVIDSSVGG